jgi:hypothetical protein
VGVNISDGSFGVKKKEKRKTRKREREENVRTEKGTVKHIIKE